MLPGLCPSAGFMATGGDPFWSAASAATVGSSATLTIDKPAGTVSGDILVAFVSATTGGGITWTGDSGWTEVLDMGTEPSLRVAYKVAGGSEGSNYTFTGSASSAKVGIIACYRALIYDTAGGSATTITGDGALAIAGITASADGALLAAVASGESGLSITHSVPSGMTLISSIAHASGIRMSLFRQQIAAGATGTRSSTVGGGTSTENAGILVALK